jgi:SAM-dependent methyltransferase
VDLNDGLDGVIEQLHGRKFDRILLLDILEHLSYPERILRQCTELLQKDGEVIVSVPNVANISVRLSLLFGNFNYADRGILDRTHVRWFTRKTARQFLRDAGYRIVAERETVIPIALALGISPTGILFAIINSGLALLTRLLPGVFGYQIMLVARRRHAVNT